MRNLHQSLLLGAALAGTSVIAAPLPASADSSATGIAIAAGAIVGALLIDSNNHPYYVRNNHRYYVTQNEANYYRAHHHVVQRNAWVPESEYPVGRTAGYHFNQNDMRGGDRNDR